MDAVLGRRQGFSHPLLHKRDESVCAIALDSLPEDEKDLYMGVLPALELIFWCVDPAHVLAERSETDYRKGWSMHLQIDTHDRSLLGELFGHEEPRCGNQCAVPGGASLTFSERRGKGLIGGAETLDLLLTFSSGVASGVVAAWLYDKLKGRAATVRVEKREIVLDKGEIQKIIEERVSVSE